MTASEISAIAKRQLAEYDAHRPGRIFEDASFALTRDEAYEVQMQVAALRVARGEPIAGYKIGCVSKAVQQQLGLSEPAFGHVFATEIYQSDAVLDAGAFEGLAIEGELAVRVAEDIPSAAWMREHPDRAIASFFTVIELHNHVFRAAKRTAQELIANNALHAGVVMAPFEFPWLGGAELDGETIVVIRNGERSGMATCNAIPGGPLASVLNVAEHLATFGIGLKQGQIVLTGSPLPLYPAAPGDRIKVHGPRSGEVGLTVSTDLPG